MNGKRHASPANDVGLPAEPLTAASIAQTAPTGQPEFTRLPPSGLKCAYCGLSRSALNSLILPTPDNNFKPPVRSFVIRKRGARTGIRLIDYQSLVSFIRSRPAVDPAGDKVKGDLA